MGLLMYDKNMYSYEFKKWVCYGEIDQMGYFYYGNYL